MANLYIHQMQRGGIIDSTADESNVISIQSEETSGEVSICYIHCIYLDDIFCTFFSHSYFFNVMQQARKSSKRSAAKPRPTEMQLNQARQAAALALRNATMVKNEDEDEDDEDDNDRRRHHGRRGGNRFKNSEKHRRNGHHHNQKAAAKIGGENNDSEQASGSNKR